MTHPFRAIALQTLAAATLATAPLLAAAQAAAPAPYGAPIVLEQAKKAMAAAEAEARKNNWPVVIAVVDAGGHAIAAIRLDGTQSSSVETAFGKARAAVAFKRPTRILEEMINGGRAAFATIPGGPYALLQGGLPIEVEGQVIGGIGVSGVTSFLSSASEATKGFIVEPGSKMSVSARLRSCAPDRLRRLPGL